MSFSETCCCAQSIIVATNANSSPAHSRESTGRGRCLDSLASSLSLSFTRNPRQPTHDERHIIWLHNRKQNCQDNASSRKNQQTDRIRFEMLTVNHLG